MVDLNNISTEQFNPDTENIDTLSTLDMVKLFNEQDKQIAFAVEKALPQIAQGVDLITERLQNGGRLFYIGAGTSGRLGILDASELLPTFSFPQDRSIGIIAGGKKAIVSPVEGAEDDAAAGPKDLEEAGFGPEDVLIGIAASGRTPYVIGALDHARETGAGTISIACSAGAEVSKHAEVAIEAVTGPESISGSTRMKAGTAQKMILNMLSTGSMVKLGKVYSNLMVDLMATNEKLLKRSVRIVAKGAGCSETEAEKALEEAGGSAKVAIMMLKSNMGAMACKSLLAQSGGHIREALEKYASMGDDIIIRPYAPGDAGHISNIIATTYRISNSKDYDAEYIENDLAKLGPEDIALRAESTHFYVACDGEKVVGCGGIMPYMGREDESIITAVFILPEYQGSGAGRRIIETLLKDEFALRAGRVEVPASITAYKFYKKMGFGHKGGVEAPDETRRYPMEKFL